MRFANSRRSTLLAGWVGFALVLGYVAAGKVLHDRAVDKALPLAGGHVIHVEAYPSFGSILVWRVVCRSEKDWTVCRVHALADASAPVRHETVPESRNKWVSLAREYGPAERFDRATRGSTRAKYSYQRGRHVVDFYDMRYGPWAEGAESLWTLREVLDDAGKVIGVERRPMDHGSTHVD